MTVLLSYKLVQTNSPILHQSLLYFGLDCDSLFPYSPLSSFKVLGRCSPQVLIHITKRNRKVLSQSNQQDSLCHQHITKSVLPGTSLPQISACVTQCELWRLFIKTNFPSSMNCHDRLGRVQKRPQLVEVAVGCNGDGETITQKKIDINETVGKNCTAYNYYIAM